MAVPGCSERSMVVTSAGSSSHAVIVAASARPDRRSDRLRRQAVELVLERPPLGPHLRAGLPSKTILPSWMNRTRSATGSTSWRMWVETSTVFDLPSSRISVRTPRIWFGSRPAGRLVHDQDLGVVQQRLRHRDPLAVALGELADRLVRDRLERALRRARRRSGSAGRRPTCPAPGRRTRAGRAGSCRDRAGRSRAGSRGARPPRSGRPGRRSRRSGPCPRVGATNPVRSRIVVVLPAPLGPRNATTCPRGIENVTSRTARNVPNCLESPWASIITGVDMPSSSSQPTGLFVERTPSDRVLALVARRNGAFRCSTSRFGAGGVIGPHYDQPARATQPARPFPLLPLP